MEKADLGLIGLAVMGQNLVLNLCDHGYRVAVYNRTKSRTKEFVDQRVKGEAVTPTYSLTELVQKLKKPRRLFLMVKAGPAVDAVLQDLIPLLEPGDLIIDGGNSFFQDTIRREKELKSKGLLYLGVGISGGEEGARHGPSIMPGGSREAWNLAADFLTAIAARTEDGSPCCAYLGPNGAGHFVKMVHNGIEYADMQLIAEAYMLLSQLLGLPAAEQAQVFSTWNRGELQSYLIEITADILRTNDEETGRPLVDVILDTAGQKGTGRWTAMQALELGVPAPTIATAVFSRYLSSRKEERAKAAEVLAGPAQGFTGSSSQLIETLRKALYGAKICTYAQGFALLDAASRQHNWQLDLGSVAEIWRAGCIIRARFLDRIATAYRQNPSLSNLLFDSYFAGIMNAVHASLRQVAKEALQNGLPVPALSSTLAYYDSYRASWLPANLIQAQRDYFGAHTYQRSDRPGIFHTKWKNHPTSEG